MRYLYIYLLPFSSRWGCSNGGLNVVFVTLPWDVNERIFVSPTVRRLIAVCNVLPLLMSWWSFLRPMDLVMTKWNGSFVHWPLFWMRRLPEGIMIIHQLPPTPRSFNLETAMGIWWAHPFFFFWQLWRLGFHPSAVITQWLRGVCRGHVSR